ncbi:MAG TPA: SRPBCC family protein [Steroidobacteraceae bacterium]|nr:SRPBCC family protein [Steroidobacteraceae bacterium]
MSRYQLESHWHVDAPIEAVWDALHAVEDWPRWWPSVLAVREIAKGDAGGVGAVHHFTWGSALPYQLSFQMRTTRVRRPFLLEGVAEGELSGVGRWTLSPSGTGTAVHYDWEVSTTRTWMNVMAPFLGPMFRWNHGKVMASGAQGLNAWLRARGAAQPR